MKYRVMHIVSGFYIGGMENLLVDVFNKLDAKKFEHIVVCLNGFAEQFCNRVAVSNVRFVDMEKEGKSSLRLLIDIFTLVRESRPSIVQTYNIGTLEYQLSAFAGGVQTRLHAEHGRAAFDPEGTNRRYNFFRKVMNPLIHRWIVVSSDLSSWLENTIKVKSEKIELIYNGIDTEKFTNKARVYPFPDRYQSEESLVIGTVGRLDRVKDHRTLLKAFRLLLDTYNGNRKLFLVVCGEGGMMNELLGYADELSISEKVWFCGPRGDVESVLNAYDIFVLSSIAEGVPLSLLEAMATKLPVVVTKVGGNGEVVTQDSGKLVPPKRPDLMAKALLEYVDDDTLRQTHGNNGRERVLAHFSLNNMVQHYQELYTIGNR